MLSRKTHKAGYECPTDHPDMTTDMSPLERTHYLNRERGTDVSTQTPHSGPDFDITG